MRLNPKIELLCECILLIMWIIIGFISTFDTLVITTIIITIVVIVATTYRIYIKNDE